MKDNNICFSKTLLFLALIGAAVVLGVLTMNKKITTKSEAGRTRIMTCNAIQASINSGCELRKPTTVTLSDGTTSRVL